MVDPFTLVADQLAPRAPDPTLFTQLGYTPTAKQQLFHQATEFDVLYGGAAGGGKTRALLMEGISWCHTWPGIRVGAFRRTYTELEESLLVELAQIGYAAQLGARWNGTKYNLTFPNGAVMMFRYAENLADATRRQGGQYQGLLFDERTLTPPEVVDFLCSRLRSGRADIPVLGIRSGSNPGGTGHGAVKAKFITPTNYGQQTYTDVRGRTVRFIPSTLDDNPHVNAEYAHDLDALPETMRKAFRDGSWDVFAGQFFAEWQHDRHVVPAFTIPTDWRRLAGIDWGYAAPWAVEWGAVDEDGRVWVYDELYATQVGESDQAKRILAAEEAHPGPVPTRYGDDAMWTSRGEAKSVAQVYRENGCRLLPAKKGERLSGWARVRSYLADGPACPLHRALGWVTCPMLHVLDGAAPDLVRTLPNLPFDTTPTRIEDVDTKAEDHAADALRYLLIQLRKSAADRWLDPEPDHDDTVLPVASGPFDAVIDAYPDTDTWQEVSGLWD